MLAAKLFGPGDVRVVECPVPEIGPDEILLKTSAAAICGSDLRMIKNGYKNVDEEHPLTLGHEFAGVIEQVGENVACYEKGMRVCLAPNMGCGVCDMCASGNTHLCDGYEAFGINMDGGFAEYIRIPARAISQGNMMILPEDVSMEVACMLEPLSCVVNGQSRLQIPRGGSVLVIGAGPIGIMHAQLAKASGAGKVMIRDLSAARMEQAHEVDADILPLTGENLLDAVMKETDGKGVDVCITACPSPVVQKESLSLMAMNGQILFFGGLPAGKDLVELPTNLIHYRQLAIYGSTRASVSQFREAARLALSGRVNLAPLATASYPIDRFGEAVAFAASAQGLKTVIAFA